MRKLNEKTYKKDIYGYTLVEEPSNKTGKYVANELKNMDEGLTVVLKNDAKSKQMIAPI